jgi:hypothetical protein
MEKAGPQDYDTTKSKMAEAIASVVKDYARGHWAA